MRFDLYRPVDDEQSAWALLAAGVQQNEVADRSLTAEQADRLAVVAKKWPWLSAGVNLALVQAGADDQTIAAAAQGEAQSKGEQRLTAGKLQMWSQPGDVISG